MELLLEGPAKEDRRRERLPPEEVGENFPLMASRMGEELLPRRKVEMEFRLR